LTANEFFFLVARWQPLAAAGSAGALANYLPAMQRASRLPPTLSTSSTLPLIASAGVALGATAARLGVEPRRASGNAMREIQCQNCGRWEMDSPGSFSDRSRQKM